MVQGIPYVHWKIINERVAEEIEPNYIWATTVEAERGPMLEPVLVTNADQAESLFGIDLKPFFAQGGKGVYVVRVGAESEKDPLTHQYADPEHIFKPAHYDIKLGEAFTYKKVAQKLESGKPVRYAMDGTTAKKVVLDETTNKYKFADTEGPGNIEESSTKIQLTAEEVTIDAGKPVLSMDTKYPGKYSDIEITLASGLRSGYNLTIKDSNNSLVMTNVNDLAKIVKRIDDRQENLYAALTDDGKEISKITLASKTSFAPYFDEAGKEESDILQAYSSYPEGTIIGLPVNDKGKIPDYEFKLQTEIAKMTSGSNGYWDDEANRVDKDYQATAHRDGLQLLESIRVGGIFCMYEEDLIQREYVLHGHGDGSDDYGMNSDNVCRWRMILLGASSDQDNYIELEDRAKVLNDQYTLFLGQGLIENYYDEDGSRKRVTIPPYKATQYIAGLRSKLFYGDAIFGGESKKEIKSAYDDGDLEIAPLYPATESKLIWEPYEYEKLNEVGVLTFTTEYNQLTLTDGVTTRQDPKEEDEEGVVSILKWAQHKVRDVCVPFIGRNITTDLQVSLESTIKAALEEMKVQDSTIISIPNEGINAYEIEVVTNPRKLQLVGKIYVHLKITPVHALRQIEVDMTVQ